MVVVPLLLALFAPSDALFHLREAGAALQGPRPMGTRIEQLRTQAKRLEGAMPSLRRAIEIGVVPPKADFAIGVEYRPIGQHLVAAIELDLIEGRHERATERIATLDALQDMQRGHSMIGVLVVIAVDAILFAALEPLFDRLSLPLVAQLRRSVDGRLRVEPLKEMFRRERDTFSSGPARDQVFSELIGRLDGPERAWAAPLPMIEDDPESQPVQAAMIEAMLRHRTQWRLMGLAARASEYFWREGRYPQTLAAFAPGLLGEDPVMGTPFIYELAERGFRLRSESGAAFPRPSRVAPLEPSVP